MKKLMMMFAVVAFIGSTTIINAADKTTTCEISSVDCEKCGKDKCEGKCSGEKKACCKKGEEKACCKKGGDKKACKPGCEKACCKKVEQKEEESKDDSHEGHNHPH